MTMHIDTIAHYKSHVEGNQLKIHRELYVHGETKHITCVVEVNGVRAWYCTVKRNGQHVKTDYMGKAGNEIRNLLSEAWLPEVIAEQGIEQAFELLCSIGDYELREGELKRDLVFGTCVQRIQVEIMVVLDDEGNLHEIIPA